MVISRQYFGIENLNLTGPQKQTLFDGLRTIGTAENSPQPCERMHTRIRSDNDAMIFEALINEDSLTLLAIRTRLANIFSTAVANISTSLTDTAYGKVSTFIFGGQNKCRMVAFGMNAAGAWGTTIDSRSAAQAYLIANAAAWGE